ncbi:MAG: hypothetical protein KatS3mg054_0633 [Chloroflexus sp.]|nr:MAG: hypothetical protein KatS3mg054_0633 [Chloroflexus sp.]
MSIEDKLARQMVFRLLDVRYERRDALLTLLALNTNPDKFELGYLASRMSGGLVIEVGGADMRAILGGF